MKPAATNVAGGTPIAYQPRQNEATKTSSQADIARSQPGEARRTQLKSAVTKLSDGKALGLTPLPENSVSSAEPTKATTGPPDLSAEMTQIAESYQQEITARASKAYQDGKKDSPMYKLGELMHVKALGSRGGPYEGEIDEAKLQQQLDSLMKNDKKLHEEMKSVSQEVLSQWRETPDGRKAVKSQEDYLGSDDFQERLKDMPPSQRDKAMQQELSKLAMLDPSRASRAGENMLDKRLEMAGEHPLEGLSELKKEERTKVISEALRSSLGDTQMGAKALSDIAGQLAELPPEVDRASMLGVLKDRGISSKATLNKLCVGLAIAGMGADAANGDFSGGASTALTWASNLNTVGGAFAMPRASQLAELAKAEAAAGKTILPKTLTLVNVAAKYAKGAPVVGDALGAAMDIGSASDAFSYGNSTKGWTYVGAAGLGAAAMGFGVAAMGVGAAGSWNPAGWAALGLGLTATGVGYVASQMDDKDETLVKRLGLFDPAASLYYSFEGMGTDDKFLRQTLTGKSPEELQKTLPVYQARYGESVRETIYKNKRGSYADSLIFASTGIREGKNWTPSADLAHFKVGGSEAISRIITTRSPEALQSLAKAFEQENGKSLVSWVKSQTSQDNEKFLLETLRKAGVS